MVRVLSFCIFTQSLIVKCFIIKIFSLLFCNLLETKNAVFLNFLVILIFFLYNGESRNHGLNIELACTMQC